MSILNILIFLVHTPIFWAVVGVTKNLPCAATGSMAAHQLERTLTSNLSGCGFDDYNDFLGAKAAKIG